MAGHAEFQHEDEPGRYDKFNQLLPADSATVQELFLKMHGVADIVVEGSVDMAGNLSLEGSTEPNISLVAVSIFPKPKSFDEDGTFHAATLTTFGSETDDFATAERQIWYRPASSISEEKYELRADEGVSCSQYDALALVGYFGAAPGAGGVLVE
jgi:hypothetical protein